jgi:hypothetical protein
VNFRWHDSDFAATDCGLFSRTSYRSIFDAPQLFALVADDLRHGLHPSGQAPTRLPSILCNLLYVMKSFILHPSSLSPGPYFAPLRISYDVQNPCLVINDRNYLCQA